MNTVIQVMIAIVMVLIGLTTIYTATDVAVDSTDSTVEDNKGTLTACLAEGLNSENCQLFGGSAEDQGG